MVAGVVEGGPGLRGLRLVSLVVVVVVRQRVGVRGEVVAAELGLDLGDDGGADGRLDLRAVAGHLHLPVPTKHTHNQSGWVGEGVRERGLT